MENMRDDLELLLCRTQEYFEADVALRLRKNTATEKKHLTAHRALDTVVKTLIKKGYDPAKFSSVENKSRLF